MTVSAWQISADRPTLTADVAVIGAGLLGCSASYYFGQAGQQVILLDGRGVGLGASSRNAGFMLSGLDTYYHQAEAIYGADTTREIWDLSQRCHAFWREIGAKHGVKMADCGSLLLAESPTEADDLAQAARCMNTNGIDCEFIAGDPLGRGYLAALRQAQDGSIHPYELTQAIFAESGAQLVADSEVYNIDSSGADIVIESRLARVVARRVLICVNAYAAQLHPFFRDKVIPVRAQCLATAPLPEPLLNAVGYSDYGYMYYRDLPDGGFLIGGGRKQNKSSEGHTTEDIISDAVQTHLEAYLKQYFPEAAQQAIVQRWAGIMGFTPDGLPLIGTLPNEPRIGFAVGLNGHGLSFGAMVAERAVDCLLNGTSAGIFDAYRPMQDMSAARVG